ncbi:DUF917 family protein [Propionimicrobium sp. PCR01-08-3]|uniref:S-methyl thiohydantoin desulfurase domain-containing protein n=1 Tax=Propionimicrobium sp. PCR01-08-3 TaxID=3052086 RepID=UPI00255CAE96|nr:DUF917 family protein [Propionimicrobium sp. PCR01-08-3]WIY83206.1 DUF917 family protein [Propionimicrobium sp. PCR01-08-3]
MRTLTMDDVEPAVYGGVVLGGGGGGRVTDSLANARLALTYGPVTLADPAELDPDSTVAVMAGVGAPAAPDQYLVPVQHVRALNLLREGLAKATGYQPLAAVVTNENGAMGTVNGWVQAAVTGLPVIDAACNGRAHPTALMGSLGLHRDPDYLAWAGFAGGTGAYELEGLLRGKLAHVSSMIRTASVEAGGLVGVARNPVPVSRLVRDGAPGAISQALEVGAAVLAAGAAGVCKVLGGQIVASGPVKGLRLEQRGGFDIGEVSVGDVRLLIANEYMAADRAGQRIARFPDLTTTVSSETGMPVTSADLVDGMPVDVVVAPREALKLSVTMDMPELLVSVEALMGEKV